MEKNQKPEEQRNAGSNANEEEPGENQTLCFDFLPFVVEEVFETDTNDSEAENSIVELTDIVVDFEDVTFEEKVKSSAQKKPSFEIKEEEIAFLPIVSELIEESYEINTIEDQSNHLAIVNEIEVLFEEVQNTSQNTEVWPSSEYSEHSEQVILDTEVIYDEIVVSSAASIENDIQGCQEATKNARSNATRKTSQSTNGMKPQDEQKFKKIIKDLIGFDDSEQPDEIRETFQNSPLLDFCDEFPTKEVSAHKPEGPDEIETDSHSRTEETIQDEPSVAGLNIPKAILSYDILDEIAQYKENTEESRMQLLDGIAEMGDWREIPLLNELLVNEKYKTVKNRVHKMIERFSKTKEKPAHDDDTLLKPFNVFEDLFRTCDTEAKLILMNEIVAVGDEGEIDFLEGLLEHDEKAISNKAARILEELKAKLHTSDKRKEPIPVSADHDLSTAADMEVLMKEEAFSKYDCLMEELQIEPPQISGIFDLTFEPTQPLDQTLEDRFEEKSGKNESIFGRIRVFYNRIIAKLNR